MPDMAAHAPFFASPTQGSAAETVRAIAAGRLKKTRRCITDALEKSGLQRAAESLLAFAGGTGTAWRPETGLALLAHRNQSTSFAALQLSAAYSGMGSSGTIEVALDRPHWLYFDGWLLPVDGQCRLESDGGSITVNSALSCAQYSKSEDEHFTPADAPFGPWFAYPTGGLAPRYVTASGLRHSSEGFPWISAAPSAELLQPPATENDRIAVIHEGWQVILDKTPVYRNWVASTATGCMLLDKNGINDAQSGSGYDHPGLIALMPPNCPVFCGELLVHECSHQHLLIYIMVVPVVTPGSNETAYSPIKGAIRTIERVLLGAHAVGNMIIYYAELSRSMSLDRASKERFDLRRKWFAEDYRPALNNCVSLTPAGRELWNSLCRAVDSAMEN